MNNKIFLTLALILFQLLVFSLVSVALDKPMGSVGGQVTLERGAFQLQFADMKSQKVYVTATGPREGNGQERGVWVRPDGTFRIDHLPKGEYSLKVHAYGYDTEYLNGIFVDDGKITQLKSIVSLGILHPSVSIASNRKVFTSKESPYFWINCSGANKAQVRLYKTDIVKLRNNTLAEKAKVEKKEYESINFGTNLSLYKTYGGEEPKFFDKQKPVVLLNRKIESNSEDWANLQFKLDKPLAYGDYIGLAEVSNLSGEKSWDIFWFNVSDIGLVIKHDSKQLIAQAIDLNSLKPVENASISIAYNNSTVYLNDIKTNQDGMANISLLALPKTLESNTLLTTGSYGQSRTYGGLWFYGTCRESNNYRTYFYTERPVYRLGQTVYFKAITRNLADSGFVTPKIGTVVKAMIEDPNNNKIWQGDFKTNEFGSFNGLYNIPDEGSTGAYQLTFTFPDGSTQYGSFEVAQYRKPEYEVSVSPTQARIIAGNKLKAKIKATYYFGAPVANAQIKYSVYASNDSQTHYKLMPRPQYFGYFDDWSEDDGDSPGYGTYSGGGEYITEGTAQTDSNGEAIVEVETKKPALPSNGPYDSDFTDKIYKIEAQVTDLSRMSVIGSGNCFVSAGNFVLYVQPDNYVVSTGQQIPITVTAIDYDKKPVANQNITVKLGRWLWDQKNSKYLSVKTEGQKVVTTNEQGKAQLTFEAKNSLPSDTYMITAQANDSLGDFIYDQSSIWIASEHYPYLASSQEAAKETLQVKADKFAYQPGETAKVVITAPVTGKEGVKALIAIEGKKIHKWWTVPLTATAKMIEIPINADYAPNVYVTASVIGIGHKFYNQSQIIRVSPKEHFLDISVSTDKEKYKPGDIAKYTIKAINKNGKPVADTELSFGLVDESIYAIRSETAENIEKFFYDRRANEVITCCTFADEYSGGPDKLEPISRVRKDFRDTAIWLPNLKTDINGIATANVTLPDNLTTWRATVRGVTKGTDIGWTINKVISTQDLIVRLSLPRFFSLGDETFINAVVHNYTKESQPISLVLSTTAQFSVKEKIEQHLTVAPDKAERFSWPIKVISPGIATVSINARGKTASDAMETKINVLSLGVPEFAIQSGELLEEHAKAEIPLVRGTEISPGTFKHQLGISASSIGPVLGNFDKLIEYPYGCTEQTMSRLIPSVVAMKLHKELKLPIDQTQSQRFAKVYKCSMAKLKDYQHNDGGWGWWKDDPSSLYLTGLVLEGFDQLKQVGYQIDTNQTKHGLEWLKSANENLCKQLTDPKLTYPTITAKEWQEREFSTDLAENAYALSLYKIKMPAKVTQWLMPRISVLPPEALSYLTMAFKKNNDPRFEKTYKQLLYLANRTNDFVDWDHTKDLLKRLKAEELAYYDYTYRYTGTETTALALRTVLVVEPSNTQLIESIKHWLLLQRDNNGWTNTKTTSQVFLALLEEQLCFNKNKDTNETLKIILADKLLKELHYSAENCYGAEEQISLSQPDKGKIDLDKSGSGRIYYNSLITYIRQLKAGENIAATGSPKGLSVERSFYRLKPGATTSDGKIHFRSELITDGIIQSGETVLMKVVVNSPVRLPYMILEAYLPSGAEVVQDSAKEDLVEENSNKDSVQGDWERAWWSHQDILDDRIVFFSTDLKQGKSEFSTLVRMEMPGTYQINPLRLEGMYAKNVRAYSNLDKIQVAK